MSDDGGSAMLQFGNGIYVINLFNMCLITYKRFMKKVKDMEWLLKFLLILIMLKERIPFNHFKYLALN